MSSREHLFPIGSLVKIINGRYRGRVGIVDGYNGPDVYDISMGTRDSEYTPDDLSRIAEGKLSWREVVIRTARPAYHLELVRYPKEHSRLTAKEKEFLIEKQEEVARTQTRRIIM